MQIDSLLQQNPLIPVIVLNDSANAKPLANALLDAGINIFEVTLRTPAALDAIQEIKQAFPEAITGAGTVINHEQMQAVIDAGCDFAVSPGLNQRLIETASQANLPYLPGVSSCSEIMQAISLGLTRLKLFPAGIAGGISFLKQIATVFPQIQFCPTGGVNAGNFKEYLALNNVAAIGGSFLAPSKLIAAGRWKEITSLIKEFS